jgi:rhomboid family protein
MGIYDRDYYRRSPSWGGGFGSFEMWTVTTWLIVINVAVFLLDNLTHGLLSGWGYFSIAAAIYKLQVWRFISFQFLHAGLEHIFFNMLALYFFGPMIESYLGPRRYLAFYLISGIGGGLGYVVLNYLGFLNDGPYTELIGASAGIFGILIAAARVAPDAQVMLLIPPIPMKLKTLAWIFLGIAAYTVLASGNNAGGQAAHLGGALVGYILIRNDQWLDFANRRWGRMFHRRRMVYRDWHDDRDR